VRIFNESVFEKTMQSVQEDIQSTDMDGLQEALNFVTEQSLFPSCMKFTRNRIKELKSREGDDILQYYLLFKLLHKR
jgi:hypothetical protein